MDLFPFLAFTVIFCCLAILVTAQGDKGTRVVLTSLIVVEVCLLLLVLGIASAPLSSRSTVLKVLSGVVAIGAMIQFLRQAERAFSLLAAFAGLQQLFVTLGVIDGVDL